MVGLVNQISHNAQEQNIGIEQTTYAVGQIDQAIQKGASLILENASLAQYLGGVAEKLDQLVMAFQFDQNAKVVEVVHASAPRALVVDDNDPSRKLAAALIKAKGFVVDSASSGNEAVAKFRANPDYQVVMMDIMMSNGNGLDAIKQIRAMSSSTKIIALTADQSLRDEVRSAGTQHFLVKPLTPQALNQFM
jgi:CheY-like chemotaxis protein